MIRSDISKRIFHFFGLFGPFLLFGFKQLVRSSSLSSIQVFTSNNDGLRVAQLENIDWTKNLLDRKKSIRITGEKFQRYDGVGGSFMRAGAKVLNLMPINVQDSILHDLFDPVRGAGFILGKIPIGATDFGVPVWYTYAEIPQNESLPFFSVEHDLDNEMGFIPYVQRAMKVAGRQLRLEATMDYAPWWMLNSSTPLPSADLNSSLLGSLANYYLKYVQALSENGINIEVLSLFNENPDSYIAVSNDNCQKLLVDHLGPLFKANKGMPKLTWTEKFSRRITAEETPAFYEMNGVEEYTDVIFYHGYDCNYGPAKGLGWQCDNLNTSCPYLEDSSKTMRSFYEKYGKNRTLWMTEVCYASEFGDYNTSKGCAELPRLDFQDMTQWADMLFADFNIVGANGWVYWNMILDMTGGPWLASPEHNDPDPNPQQPVIVVDPTTGVYYKTGVYYAMTHFGRFIPPGSYRIGLDISSDVPPTVSSIAFFDEISSKIVLILMNKGAEKVVINLKLDEFKTAQLKLDPISISTFIFSIEDISKFL